MFELEGIPLLLEPVDLARRRLVGVKGILGAAQARFRYVRQFLETTVARREGLRVRQLVRGLQRVLLEAQPMVVANPIAALVEY